MKRGDVVLVPFPNSNLKSVKLRPAIIVQKDNLSSGLNQVIIAMIISSNLSRANHPSRILIEIKTLEGKQSGLLTDSVIMTDNLATVLETNILRVIGNIRMTEVDLALRHTLGL